VTDVASAESVPSEGGLSFFYLATTASRDRDLAPLERLAWLPYRSSITLPPR
jgi:hypothetical protein